MPKVIENLDMETLIELHGKGMSYQMLATRFGVSRETIKNRFRDVRRVEKNTTVTDFAARLEKLVSEAPDGLCRKELQRAVNFIRTKHNVSPAQRKSQILHSIETGGRTIEDIADDCGLDAEETIAFRDSLIDLLEELITEKKIIKVSRGGVLNRGRKTKYHYLLA